MILIRYFLIGLIIFLIIHSFSGNSSAGQTGGQQPKQGNDPKPPSKKVSGKIGEYIDYEEVKDKP